MISISLYLWTGIRNDITVGFSSLISCISTIVEIDVSKVKITRFER